MNKYICFCDFCDWSKSTTDIDEAYKLIDKHDSKSIGHHCSFFVTVEANTSLLMPVLDSQLPFVFD